MVLEVALLSMPFECSKIVEIPPTGHALISSNGRRDGSDAEWLKIQCGSIRFNKTPQDCHREPT